MLAHLVPWGETEPLLRGGMARFTPKAAPSWEAAEAAQEWESFCGVPGQPRSRPLME